MGPLHVDRNLNQVTNRKSYHFVHSLGSQASTDSISNSYKRKLMKYYGQPEQMRRKWKKTRKERGHYCSIVLIHVHFAAVMLLARTSFSLDLVSEVFAPEEEEASDMVAKEGLMIKRQFGRSSSV
jgi:hypothetical protein